MKKQLIALTALAGFAMGASLAFGGATAGSGIVGSKHDMNLLSGATADTQGRVCAFCHTPHHKLDASQLDYNPLWSHEINNSTFTEYGAKTVTFDSTIEPDPLTGPSRLCMSCHDGVIAVDQHYGIAGANPNSTHIKGDDFGQIAVGLNNDLSNDHPIGFDITNITTTDAAMAGGMQVFGNAINANLVAPHNNTLNGQTIQQLGFDMGAGKLIFTCASCHEVHNKDNVENYFLYEKQKDSAFCTMCHNK